MAITTSSLGSQAEQAAQKYLTQAGLALVAKNYSCKLGEIDLIMKDKNILVFIEVRLRNNTKYGNGILSVNLPKQKKIIRTATHFLCQKGWFDKVHCRFDIIGISYTDSDSNFEWLKNAFTIDDHRP